MDEDAIVIDVVHEIIEEEPPQLFDLTGLQKEANSRYGLSAAETLSCAQSLYEEGELSYPRTSSHSITSDMVQSVSELLSGTEGASFSGVSHSGTGGVAASNTATSVVGETASRNAGISRENTPQDETVKISPEDAEKLAKWKDNRPDDEKYIANKEIYDNPKYFNQESGEEIWPGENGDKNTDGFVDGKYEEKDIEKGSKIDRYGGNYGRFFAETGTPIENRAMSPNSPFSRYNRYEVKRPFPVREGKIAPWFGQPGGGTQFMIPKSFENELRDTKKLRPNEPLIDGLVRLGYLKRV